MKSGTSEEVVLNGVQPRPPVSRRRGSWWCWEEMLGVRALAVFSRVAVSRDLGRPERRVRGDWGGRQGGQAERAQGAPTRLTAATAEMREIEALLADLQ